MILEDANFVLRLERICDILALVGGEDDTAVVEVDAMRPVEAEGVLHDGWEFFAEDGVCFAVDGLYYSVSTVSTLEVQRMCSHT